MGIDFLQARADWQENQGFNPHFIESVLSFLKFEVAAFHRWFVTGQTAPQNLDSSALPTAVQK